MRAAELVLRYAAPFEAERQRRLKATLAALEREHTGREGRQCAEPEVAQVHGLPEESV